MLGDTMDVLQVYTLKQAEDLFSAHPDLDAIVMDACVPGDEPTTLDLTKKFRQSFFGPIVAASSCGEYRMMLMEVGCDYESSKHKVAQTLINILEN